MSKFYKSCLAVAVAAALPAVGFAATLTTATPNLAIHAQEAVSSATTSTASNASVISYDLKAGDFLIGRTSAVKVEVTLVGAEYSGNTTVATAVQGAASGAGSSGTLFSFVLTPAAVPLAVGPLFTFAAGDLDLIKLPNSGAIKAQVKVRDLATGLELMSTEGTVMTIGAGTSVSAKAASAVKIDVTKGKTVFEGPTTTVQLGTVTAGFVDGDPLTVSVDNVSIEGSGIVANGDAAATHVDQIKFDEFNDKLALTVTAADGTAFAPITGDATTLKAGIYVSSTGAVCTDAANKMTVSATNPNEFSVSVALQGGDYNICAVANGKTVIADKGFTVAGKMDFADVKMVDKALVSTALATLAYNGPVAYVDHFNPASNADQQSYLRISNTSNLAGKITVDGVCDNGVASTTPASFNLGKGKSVLLTSSDIEIGNPAKGMGNGLGACAAGKYRLTVTGEIGTMKVQNFLRNTTSAGLINTNINNEK